MSATGTYGDWKGTDSEPGRVLFKTRGELQRLTLMVCLFAFPFSSANLFNLIQQIWGKREVLATCVEHFRALGDLHPLALGDLHPLRIKKKKENPSQRVKLPVFSETAVSAPHHRSHQCSDSPPPRPAATSLHISGKKNTEKP